MASVLRFWVDHFQHEFSHQASVTIVTVAGNLFRLSEIHLHASIVAGDLVESCTGNNGVLSWSGTSVLNECVVVLAHGETVARQ